MGKFCSNCGEKVNENAYVCLKCGAKITNNVSTDPNSKSKIVAGLLGIFLGAIGVHNFYLGYNGKATAQLLITILSCGVLALVSEIWGLVEGIQILTGTIDTDASGKPLKD